MRINYRLAALALLLSTTLWVLVVNDQNPDRVDIPDIEVSVELAKVPSGLVVMSNVDPVRFKIRAPKDRWSSLRGSSFRASVDLSRSGPGIETVAVVPEVSDSQVRVLEVIPSVVTVRLEEIRERTVPVKANLVGNVPFGYLYGVPKVEPEVVVVSGPSSLVQVVEVASVDVRLEGITVGIDSAFHPLPTDSSGSTVRSVRLNPQTVKVQVPVEQQVSYKQVGIRAPITGNVAPGYWVESVVVDPPAVTVVGDPKVLAGINYLETAAVNLSSASSGLVQDLQLVVPQGISLLQPQQTARVRVNVSALQTRQTARVAPRVVNLDPALRVASIPPFIDVTVQGPAPIMQGLGADALGVTLDVVELGEGVHEVKLRVQIPQGVTVVSVSPESMNVTLSPVVTPSPTAATAGPTAEGTSAPQGTPVPSGTATPMAPIR